MPRWASLSPWGIGAAVGLVLALLVALIRAVAGMEAGRRARLREVLAAVAQYGLLFGFVAVAAAVSAHGLIGFARTDMELRGVWPFLLWAALDGAAALCAVLLMRRAARGESAVAPRLAVWGLVAASSVFNWTHAPDRPGARGAFALMPVIAAMLFEFSLRETRHVAGRADRRLAGLRWLRPAERVQVQFLLAGEAGLDADAATRRVRVERAAWSLHRLRRTVEAGSARQGRSSRRVRRAERRAQVALVHARFTEPDIAADVLRQARVLAQTIILATSDTAAPLTAELSLAGLVVPRHDARPGHPLPGCPQHPGPSAGSGPRIVAAQPAPSRESAPDRRLLDVAAGIVSEAQEQGVHLSQAELARRLRAGGMSIANGRLRWLAAATGLEPCGESR